MDIWCPDCLGYFSFLPSMPFPLQGIQRREIWDWMLPSLLKRGISRILSRILIGSLSNKKRRRLRKWKLNSRCLKLYRAYSVSFNSTNLGKFSEFNSKGLYQSSRKEKESCFLVFLSSKKREIRHFHVVVVQRRHRNVQKSVMHVQSCCFANLRACLHGGGGPQVGEVTCLCGVKKLPFFICNLTTPPSRGAPGKPRVLAINALIHSLVALAATFSTMAFYC